jgi:hypothetical protein
VNRLIFVHPKYRSVGLGATLIRDPLPLVETPYVEMVAVMLKREPFAEKAGLQKVVEQQPLKEVKKNADTTLEFGSNLSLLGSKRYVSEIIITAGLVVAEGRLVMLRLLLLPSLCLLVLLGLLRTT